MKVLKVSDIVGIINKIAPPVLAETWDNPGLQVGDPMAYLVAPPMEHTIGLDAALKAASVRAAKIFPPPTETNFAAAWLSGDLPECQAAAEAYAAAVVDVGRKAWDIDR